MEEEGLNHHPLPLVTASITYPVSQVAQHRFVEVLLSIKAEEIDIQTISRHLHIHLISASKLKHCT